MKPVRPLDLYKMMKRPGGRLLGMDVGSKYVGLAISTEQHDFASPYGILERGKHIPPLRIAKEILRMVNDLSLEGIIVGYPFQKSKIHPRVKHVHGFVDDLEWTGILKEIPFAYWDENFTTKAVKELLYPMMFEPPKEKLLYDTYSATGILQSYIDAGNRYQEYMTKSGGR